MNYPLVCKLLSIILIALAGAFSGSYAVAWLLDEGPAAARAEAGFAISALVTLAVAGPLYLAGRRGANVMHGKEAIAVIGLGWICASVVGALPYLLIVPEIGWAGALFESTSGLTTTGASVLSDLERLPHGLHFWRSISQWIGGLGVVVFFVAVLSFLGAGAKVLFARESSAQAADLEASRIQHGILRLMYYYLGLSVACLLVFYWCGLQWWDALTHMFTTVSTGGFSTRSLSIGAFENPRLEWACIVFMLLGGTSFIPMVRACRGDWSSLRRSTEIRWYYSIAVGATVMVGYFLLIDPGFSFAFHQILRAAAFQSVSILTTSGFATENYNGWLPAVHVVLILLMTVGGCSGSTSGGAKVIRIVIAAKVCVVNVERAFRARVVRRLRVNSEPVDANTQENVLVFLVMLAGLTLLSALALALLEPTLSLEGMLSAMFACLFNIGPGFAEVGPLGNYAHFNSPAKVLLAFLMILGRVELFAMLALFAPSLWKKF